MIKNCYTSVNNGKLVQSCKNTQHYVPQEIYLLKNNFLGEFRTALEKAKVRANLGIADTDTLYWGNIQGDITNQVDISNYIDRLLAFNYDAEKGFDAGNNFENIQNVRQAAITCLQFLSKFKGEGDAIESLDAKIKQLINNLYGVDSLDKIVDSESGIINTIIKDLNNLKNSLSNATSKIEDIELKIITISAEIESLNNSLQEINNLIKISSKENNALITESDGLYVPDLSKTVTSNTLEIETLSDKLSEVENNQSNYLTREDFGSDDLDFVTQDKLDTKLKNYIINGQDGNIDTLTVNNITSNKNNIEVDKPINYNFSGPSDPRLHVKTQEELLSINPDQAWKGMPVVVEDDAIMYILTKEPTVQNISLISSWKSADSLKIEVLTYEEYANKKASGKINPSVYYYIIEDEVELSEIPSISQYIDDNGNISEENLQKYKDAIDLWYADAYKLHREYMSAIWGVDMEKKLNNKVSVIDFNYLKDTVEKIKNSSADNEHIQELESKIKEILGDQSDSSKTGRLIKVENNVEKVIKDLYATDTDGNPLEGLDPKYVTWEALENAGGLIDTSGFLLKEEEALIPSIKSTTENFTIKQQTSEPLITIKETGEVINSKGVQLGYDKDIPYIVWCDDIEDYKNKLNTPIQDNPNNKEILYLIRDLDPGSDDSANNCYITLSQFKQFAATKRQLSDISSAWGKYRSAISGSGSTDQFGNQLYNYISLSSIIDNISNTVIPEKMKDKVDISVYENNKSTTDLELSTIKENIRALVAKLKEIHSELDITLDF